MEIRIDCLDPNSVELGLHIAQHIHRLHQGPDGSQATLPAHDPWPATPAPVTEHSPPPPPVAPPPAGEAERKGVDPAALASVDAKWMAEQEEKRQQVAEGMRQRQVEVIATMTPDEKDAFIMKVMDANAERQRRAAAAGDPTTRAIAERYGNGGGLFV